MGLAGAVVFCEFGGTAVASASLTCVVDRVWVELMLSALCGFDVASCRRWKGVGA